MPDIRELRTKIYELNLENQRLRNRADRRDWARAVFSLGMVLAALFYLGKAIWYGWFNPSPEAWTGSLILALLFWLASVQTAEACERGRRIG